MKAVLTSAKTLSLGTAVLGVMLLAGCENMGHLYPVNEQAEGSSDLPVHITTLETGNGTIEAIGVGGEVLKGSYGPAPGNYDFGPIFKAVYGDYSTNPVHADNGTPTIATLTGNKGTTLNCEFYNNDSTNNGFGGCKSVTGALYRLQY
jgi:outer membrane murein-binding lipoprotein Lpp